MKPFKAAAMFVEVARAGSFTGAAQRLGVPLSTVSRNVSDLEDSLGTRLLERTTRKVRLTDIGRRYFEHCRRGVEAFETASRIINENQEDVSGLLRLSIPPSLGETVFAPLIARFRDRYPKVDVATVVSERTLDLIDDGIDLSFRPGAIHDDKLVALKLLSYRHMLLATPAFLSECGTPKHPDDLDGFSRVAFGFPDKNHVQWRLQHGGKTHELSFQPNVSFNDYAAVRGAILQGLGIGELPEILCGELVRSGKLVEVMTGWTFPAINLHAVHSGIHNTPMISRVFLEAAREYFTQFPRTAP